MVVQGTKYSNDLAHYEDPDRSESKADPVAYAVSPQALGGNQYSPTKTEELKYDYVQTGPISVRNIF